MPEQTCTYPGCYRPVYQDSAFSQTDKCIFHCEEKDPQEFRDALASEVSRWQKNNAKDWNFWGWIIVVEAEHEYDLFADKVFPVTACFDDAVFVGDVSFHGATFAGEAYFRGTKFTGEASFQSVVFAKESDLSKSTLLQGADFVNAVFTGNADFNRAEFSGPAYFVEVRFSEYADFRSVTFGGNAEFMKATFAEDTDFSSAMFSEGANFEGAAFCRRLDLSYTRFAILGDLLDVGIEEEVDLTWPGEGHVRQGERRGRLLLQRLTFNRMEDGKEPFLDLRNNVLHDDSKLAIEDMRTERVLLEGIDCRQIEFLGNVEWPRWKGRQVVGDEYFARKGWAPYDKEVDWNLIAITYQQLTDRFRKDLNHPVANDFERGIFECRLMAALQKDEKGRRDWRNVILLSLYKAASNFGGSILLPVAWVLFILTACSLCYGGLLFGGKPVWLWQTDWNLFFESWTASMRVMSLDRTWLTHQILDNHITSGWAALLSFIALLQTALTATLVTLFIFAIRRRFKHSE